MFGLAPIEILIVLVILTIGGAFVWIIIKLIRMNK